MIAILNYDAGNIKSVENALTRLEVEYVTTDDLDLLATADKIIFPGVGHAGAAMESLQNKGLDVFLKSTKQPVLGICVGMQLLFEKSEEGDTECLGIIPGKVVRFQEDIVGKVPHINWCAVEFDGATSPLSKGEREGFGTHQEIPPSPPLTRGEYYYFVHSYYAPINEFTVASAHYGDTKFTAMVQKDNFTGTQFHPEKSGDVGAKVLENFINDEL